MNNKKIIVADSYARNTGDVAILISLISQIQEKYPESEIIIESSHPKHLINNYFEDFKNIEIIPRIIDIEDIDGNNSNKLRKYLHILIGLYDYFSFLLWSFLNHLNINLIFLVRKKRRAQAKILMNIDFVISTGGGFISTYYNYYLRLSLYLILLLLKKPFFISGQSIGPFNTYLSKKMIPFVLQKAKLITVRESWSFDYLLKYNLRPILTADWAFLLPVVLKDKQYFKPSVSICIKCDNKEKRDEYYKKIIIELSEYLNKLGYFVKIVCQTPADDLMGQEIISKLFFEDFLLIKYGINPKVLKAEYANDEFIISSRMHAIIFAAERFVPFIALSYEPKFEGLFDSMGYDDTLIFQDNELNSDLLKKTIDKILREKENLSMYLKKKMPKIKSSSEQNIKLIFDIYEKNKNK